MVMRLWNRFIIGTYVNWQYQAVACGVIPIVFHAFMMFAPESPRYLVEQRKLSDASKALCWLRGAKSTQHIQREMNEVKWDALAFYYFWFIIATLLLGSSSTKIRRVFHFPSDVLKQSNICFSIFLRQMYKIHP